MKIRGVAFLGLLFWAVRPAAAEDLSTAARRALATNFGGDVRITKVSTALGTPDSTTVSTVWQPLVNRVVPPGEWWDQTGTGLVTIYSYWLQAGAVLGQYRPSRAETEGVARARALLYRKRDPVAVLKGMTDSEARPAVVRYFLSLEQALAVLSDEQAPARNSQMLATTLLEAAANEGEIKRALTIITQESGRPPEERRSTYLGKAGAVIAGLDSGTIRLSQPPEDWPREPGWNQCTLQVSPSRRVELDVKRVRIEREWFVPGYFAENFWLPNPDFPRAFVSDPAGKNPISQTIPAVVSELVFMRNLKLAGDWTSDDILGLDGWLRPVSPDPVCLGVIVVPILAQPVLSHPYYPK